MMGRGVLLQRAEKVGAERWVLSTGCWRAGRQAASSKWGEKASPESSQGLIGQRLPEYAGVG